ncbi:MAG: cobalamin biosynthesis protein CbiX [Verrucomicrobia bacterium RIFCSPHIGHO2_12_FULL_41_10]|nr:MAG: cobalamin biosynthesis protein CbiX [Verrucomicrobia bacterium RIFCSPHIGHO2_12_FULL_41_10]
MKNRFHNQVPCGQSLIIVGHGSTTNPDSSEPTHLHADRIRSMKIFDEVRCAFWKEEPSLREVLHGITSPEIIIVPNFISEGYFTQKVIPRELALEGKITQRGQQTIYYCDPVGSHSSMTAVILKRAHETAPEIDPAQTTLFIVGHGTQLNENSAKAAKDQVVKIAGMNFYGEVLSTYMEEAPLISDWHTMATKENVVVVPFFISDGLHSYQDIPLLLGIEKEIGPAASQAEVFRRNPYHLHGKTLYYASAIGTEPMIAEVILEQARLLR